MHDASCTATESENVPSPDRHATVEPLDRVARFVPFTAGPISHKCVSWRRQCQHDPHTGVSDRMTRSPGRTRDTSVPVHSTVPAPSWPRIIGSRTGNVPLITDRSL